MQVKKGNIIQRWGFTLFSIGFLVLLAGMILITAGSARESKIETSVGGIVFVGPFPIVFGQGPQSPALLIIGLLIVVAMALMFLSSLLSRKKVAIEQ